MQAKEYIAVLVQSLDRKAELLDLIISKNKEQRIFFLDEDTEPEKLEKNISEKAELVQRLEKLDEGFEQVYERVRTELSADPEAYREEILHMQNAIKMITEKIATVQTQEIRNKELAKKRFTQIHGKIRQVRTSSKVASQYYKSMANLHVTEPGFMDKKK